MEKFTYCYHHLHNSSHGKSPTKRLLPFEVKVSLPKDKIESYVLHIDPRDQRVLVCFDGDIPSGSLPKGSTIVMNIPTTSTSIPAVGAITCQLSKVYKQRDRNEDPPLYTVMGDEATQKLDRRFILLQTGRAVFRKYTNTLQPKYLIVDVHDGIAHFSTSSY